MWWARSEAPVQAWIGAGHVAWGHSPEDVRVEAIASRDDALDRLADWQASSAATRQVQVWLGGDLCRLVGVPAIAGALGVDDAQAAVTGYLQARGQLEAEARVHLAEMPGGSAQWRTAVVRTDLTEALQRVFGRALVSIRPWWSWALQQGRCDSATRRMCAMDGQTLVSCSWTVDGAVESADTVVPIVDAASARRWLLRRGWGPGEAGLCCARIVWPVESIERGAGSAREFLLAPWVQWSHEL